MSKIMIVFVTVCLFLFSELGAQDTLRYRICQNCNSSTTGDQMVANNYRFTYDDTLNVFLTKDITSDYGPRQASGASGWHQGVDFKPSRYAGNENGGRGTALLTPVNGRISQPIATYNGYLRVAIADTNPLVELPSRGFGFGHGFYHYPNPPANLQHLRSGNFVIKKMMSPSATRYAIIHLSSNPDEPSTAIGLAEGQDTNPRVIWGQDTISVTKFVQQGNAIIPMGGSGDGRNYNTHLHFDYFRNATLSATAANRLDPLLVVDHEMPEYSVEIFTKVDTAVSFSGQIIYPGNSPTRLMVRSSMLDVRDINDNLLPAGGSAAQYSNAAYNVDDVEILLKGQADTAFATIRGPRVESRFSQGGRLNSALYPYNLNGVDITVPILNYGINNNNGS